MKQILRPETPRRLREELVRLVNSRFEFSEKYFDAVRQRLPRLYDVWRGIFTGRFHPHKNNVHVPLIYSAIWADAARKAATSFSSWPVVTMQGYGSDDVAYARAQEQLLSAQLKDARSFMKAVDLFVRADLYGVAEAQVMWDRKIEYGTRVEYKALPFSTERVRQIKKGKIITFDGPNFEVLDRLDTAPQPGPSDVPYMKWFGRRYYLDLDDCRFLASESLADGPIFDPVEVARMEREGVGAQAASDSIKDRRYMARLGMSDDSARNMDEFARPVEIREIWGVVPSELAVDGETNLVLTVANREYLFRARSTPFWHRRIPVVKFSPTPDPHYYDAPGKAEIAEKLNLVANRYLNQRLDAADLFIDPAFFYDRNSGLNTRNLYMRPGRFIGVEGSPGERIMAMQPDLRGLQIGASLTAEMQSYVERGTGIQDDTVQGLDASQAQTARQYVGRREAAGTRLLLESRIFEEGWLEPTCNMMMQLNRQFLEAPVEYMILGDSSQVDPVTGKPVSETRGVIDGYALDHAYTARAFGAITGLSKALRQQNLLAVLQAVSAAPYIVGQINMVNFFRQFFREFDFTNVNDLINQQAPLREAMQSAGMQGAEQVPDLTQGTGDNLMQVAQLAGQGQVV